MIKNKKNYLINTTQTQVATKEVFFDLPSIKVTDEKISGGRKVVRYEHDSMPQWRYMKTQKDWFKLVLPQTPAKGAPLCVVLHSSGGNGDEPMPAICGMPNAKEEGQDRGFYGDETYYVLSIDCRTNMNDWWWGNEEITRNPELYKNELCPVEKRVLATIEWVIKSFDIDRDRVYLNGISMGGSGSLGIGLIHGDVLAAVSVVVPAGVNHMKYRTSNYKWPDPPPLFNISSHSDKWALGQEELLAFCRENKCFLAFAWGPFGHIADVRKANPAVYEYPWLSIRRNEAYPVFSNATTDNRYPGFNNCTAPDQNGQINGYFRWKNIEDTTKAFVMELRLLRKDELRTPIEIPRESVANVTLRRLQKFAVKPETGYKWSMMLAEKALQSGKVTTDSSGVLTIPAVTVSDVPLCLKIVRDSQTAEPGKFPTNP